MFKNNLAKENLAVMYLRLSKEDGEKTESNSISNQREMINSYARKNKITMVKEYVDDGYSGANFDRPNFKEMIKAAYDRKFNTIIVKDLSRFGRDYIEAGKYIQRIFPENGIRFISINDNYDSKSAGMNDTHLILPIKNFIKDLNGIGTPIEQRFAIRKTLWIECIKSDCTKKRCRKTSVGKKNFR